MRIGIDCQALNQKQYTGIPNYVRQLTDELRKLQTNHELFFFDGPKSDIPFWSRHVAYARELASQKLNLLHGPANILPLFYRGKSVITIHDLAIYKHPEWFPRGQWLATKVVVPRSIKVANQVIVPSETTSRDLQELFGIENERISVIPHGVESRFFESANSNDKFQISKKYILFVGTIEPRKNVARIVEAYASLPQALLDQFDLVLIGGSGWGNEDVFSKIENCKLKIGEKIHWLDQVSYESLPDYYKHAALFVYPSLYEGFGLPVLEAMAAGTPTICSSQIVGNFKFQSSNSRPTDDLPKGDNSQFSNPISVDAESVEEIGDAIQKVLTDTELQERMRKSGPELAREFTWERTAKQTLAVYEKANG